MEKCVICGGDVSIRNPTGLCDHLYYPENLDRNKLVSILKEKDESIENIKTLLRDRVKSLAESEQRIKELEEKYKHGSKANHQSWNTIREQQQEISTLKQQLKEERNRVLDEVEKYIEDECNKNNHHSQWWKVLFQGDDVKQILSKTRGNE